jgi:quercetin dioxygenase-like cupin family protein
MNLRRVVTGRTPDGTSVIVEDLELPARTATALPGTQINYVWGSDTHEFPADGTQPAWRTHFPPKSGFRFMVFSIPPSKDGLEVAAVSAEEIEEAEATFPGMLSVFEADSPGMHSSPSIDIAIMLSGSLTLELDNGVKTELKPGDVVIQNGTRHRWLNLSDEVATIAGTVIGAEFK